LAAEYDARLAKGRFDQLRVSGDLGKTPSKQIRVDSPRLRRCLLGWGSNDHVVEAKMWAVDFKPASHAENIA
jgi:hypothetical protein